MMFWVFPAKMPLLEVDDMLMQDHKTVFVQKSTSQVSWFFVNLVKLVIWQPWRNAEARSHVVEQWITFEVFWNRSFPPRPSKISIEWSGSQQHLLHAAVTIFAGLIWPPSSGLCMAAWPSTSPPKGLCQCIELRFSFAVEWVGRCWAGLTNIAWECLTYFIAKDHSWLMSPKLVLCESTDWHHQRRNTIQIMTIRQHTIAGMQRSLREVLLAINLRHNFRIRLLGERETSVSYVFVGWQPKESWKKWRWLGTSKGSNLMCLRLETIFC